MPQFRITVEAVVQKPEQFIIEAKTPEEVVALANKKIEEIQASLSTTVSLLKITPIKPPYRILTTTTRVYNEVHEVNADSPQEAADLVHHGKGNLVNSQLQHTQSIHIVGIINGESGANCSYIDPLTRRRHKA